MKNNKTLISARSRLYTSVLLVLLALVAVTAATVAWFSIADNTKVKSMSLDIVSGTDLRMDLDPHETLEEYVKTLSFDQIAERIRQEKGFSMQETPLEPVTTQDEETFTFENGTAADSTSGVYLEFNLHFMAAAERETEPKLRLKTQHFHHPCEFRLRRMERPGFTIQGWETERHFWRRTRVMLFSRE